jgi:hypothetical protein
MSPSDDLGDQRAGAVVASDEVTTFVAARRTLRVRATRKLEAVVDRLIAPQSPADRARDL